MNPTLASSCSLALALCSALYAQTVKYETSPPGHVTLFNHDFYQRLGSHAACRFQQGDGELMKQMAIIRMDYRLDPAVDYRQSPGRKWTNVTLRLAETKLPLSTRFSANFTTTPQTVFSSPMAWTPPTGSQPAPPANTQITPWGGHGLAFPFSSVFMYSGTKPMLREYVFRGGVLGNSTAWGNNHPFFLDGILNRISLTTVAQGHQISNTGCSDTYFGTFFSAKAEAKLRWINYSSSYPTANLKGKSEVATTSTYTRPGYPVIHALGVPLTKPVHVGAACNPLYIQPMTYFYLTATPTPGTYPGAAGSGTILFKTRPSTFHQRVAVQAAWADVKKGFALTGAHMPTLPSAPLAKPLAKESIFHRTNPDAPFSDAFDSYADCPRFAFK